MTPDAQEIKRAMNQIVIHKPSGRKYRFTAYIYREPNGQKQYQAELQDLTAKSSILICSLANVEIVED